MSAQPGGLAGAEYALADLLGLRHQAARLALSSRAPSRSQLSGAHRSRIRGRGMTYAESRPYQAGDDVRQIDWRVTARSGRPHTKLFEEERERPVFVVADFSPGMYFGTRHAFKHVVAAECCAVIGWAALASGDRIGALLTTPGGHIELRPSGGRRALMRLLHELDGVARPGGDGESTPLHDALERAQRVARPGSLVFVVSDFYGLDESAAGALARLRVHNDVVMVQVLDAVEIEPPPAGQYPVSDGRRIARLDLASAARRSDHAAMLERLRTGARQLAARLGVAHGMVRAGSAAAAQLAVLLERRG